MEDKYTDSAYDYAKFICEKYKLRQTESVLSSIRMYIKCQISDEEFLQVLQWLPESPRTMIWRGYQKSNLRCK